MNYWNSVEALGVNMDISFSLLKDSVWVNIFICYVYQIETSAQNKTIHSDMFWIYFYMSYIVPLYKKSATQTNACINWMLFLHLCSCFKKIENAFKIKYKLYTRNSRTLLMLIFILIYLILSMIVRLLANNSLLFLSVFAGVNLC